MKLAFNKEGLSKVPGKVRKTNASYVCVVHTVTLRCQIRRLWTPGWAGYVVTRKTDPTKTSNKQTTSLRNPNPAKPKKTNHWTNKQVNWQLDGLKWKQKPN